MTKDTQKEANIKELDRLSEVVAKVKDAKTADLDMAKGQLRVAKQYLNIDEQVTCTAWLELASGFVSSKLLRVDQDQAERT